MDHFCGNVLEVKGHDNARILAMSTKAWNAFTPTQQEKILKHVKEVVHTDVDIIETIGGGGVRCMMGELY